MEQKKILNIMVDLETTSTKENSAILSWAMVPFFTDGQEVEDAEPMVLYIDLGSCFFAKMDIDKDTQDWWAQQTPNARASILTAEKVSIQNASMEVYGWMSRLAEKYDLYMWARGLDFDIPKIEWCLRKFVGRELPYKYSHKMDVRTVLKFMGVDQTQFEFEGVRHNAVDDCNHDIKMIWFAYNRLKDLRNR